MKQSVKALGVDHCNRFFAGAHTFVHKVNSDLKSCRCGALAVAGLEHEELAAFNSELHILHVAIVFFKSFGRSYEFVVNGFVGLPEVVDGFGSADACNNVLALCVHEILAVEFLFAGGGVAGECNTGTAVVAHVAEYHALNVDRGAPIGGDIVHAAVDNCAGVIPAAENCLDSFEKLSHGFLREVKSLDLFKHGFVCFNDFLKVVGSKVGVKFAIVFFLCAVENLVELCFFNFHNDVGEHLNETAIAVICKTLVAGQVCKSNNGFVVQTEVEDRVHHAGHACTCAGTNGNEEGVFGAAEFFARLFFGNGKSCFYLLDDVIGDCAAVLIVTGAGFG